jgi:hypothetical protein
MLFLRMLRRRFVRLGWVCLKSVVWILFNLEIKIVVVYKFILPTHLSGWTN